MRVILLTILWLSAAGAFKQLVAQNPAAQQTAQQKTASILRHLDQKTDELIIVPKDLTELVRISQAAVVGRIVDFGDLMSANDVGSRGQVIGTDAFASYRISIDEVLFNRELEGPALTAGAVTTITQVVGRRDAELFVSRQFPPLDSREYLLFLWLRPGSESWSLLRWQYQFRRSLSALQGAEPASRLADGRSLLQPGWLGPSVTVVATDPDKVVPHWASLVAEVKRLSGLVRQQVPGR